MLILLRMRSMTLGSFWCSFKIYLSWEMSRLHLRWQTHWSILHISLPSIHLLIRPANSLRSIAILLLFSFWLKLTISSKIKLLWTHWAQLSLCHIALWYKNSGSMNKNRDFPLTADIIKLETNFTAILRSTHLKIFQFLTLNGSSQILSNHF